MPAPNTAYKQWRAFGSAKVSARSIARVPGQVIALNSALLIRENVVVH